MLQGTHYLICLERCYLVTPQPSSSSSLTPFLHFSALLSKSSGFFFASGFGFAEAFLGGFFIFVFVFVFGFGFGLPFGFFFAAFVSLMSSSSSPFSSSASPFSFSASSPGSSGSFGFSSSEASSVFSPVSFFAFFFGEVAWAGLLSCWTITALNW